MTWLLRLVGLVGEETGPRRSDRFSPQPPPGFVRRSDPNFYFLARKF